MTTGMSQLSCSLAFCSNQCDHAAGVLHRATGPRPRHHSLRLICHCQTLARRNVTVAPQVCFTEAPDFDFDITMGTAGAKVLDALPMLKVSDAALSNAASCMINKGLLPLRPAYTPAVHGSSWQDRAPCGNQLAKTSCLSVRCRASCMASSRTHCWHRTSCQVG